MTVFPKSFFIGFYDFCEELVDVVQQSTNSLFSLYPGGETSGEEFRTVGEECKICGKILRNRITLRRHVKDLHYAQTEEFWCKICNRSYRTKNSLVVHTCNYHQKKAKNKKGLVVLEWSEIVRGVNSKWPFGRVCPNIFFLFVCSGRNLKVVLSGIFGPRSLWNKFGLYAPSKSVELIRKIHQKNI